MGSFNFTCALSGLPITCGDEVKYFLLTENPYTDSSGVCYPHDLWYPRSQPVSAVYNDYGSIEGYDDKSPAVLSIVEAFKKDLVEVGVGNNCCHDVATSKGMSFEQILDAVQEERVLVTREFRFKESSFRDKDEIPGGVPTLQRVSKILNDAGFETNQGYGDKGYLVDEIDQGWVRIRPGGFGDKISLDPLLSLLKDFATVITAGSGNYSNRMELQVMPLPPAEGEYISFLDASSKKPCKVFQAMILQEVWDAVSAIENFDKYRKSSQKEWDSSVTSYTDILEREAGLAALEARDDNSEEMIALLKDMRSFRDFRPTAYSHIPFTMGIGEHFNIAAELHAENPFTDGQIKDFIDNVAGAACIQQMVYGIRYWWKPSFSCGPQYGGYQEQADWHMILAHISQQLKSKNECEEDE